METAFPERRRVPNRAEAMSALTTIVQILFPLLVAGVVFVMPVWLLVSGIARLGRKQGGKIRVLIGMAMLLFAAFVLDSFLGPWHEKILDKGTAPDGREFALLQVGGGEPFQIRLYVRSEEAGLDSPYRGEDHSGRY